MVGLPPIPAIQGPLAIRVVHPPSGTVNPGTDSVFVYGSVGSGSAEMAINGWVVPVQPNGAFLAYIPRPANDSLRIAVRDGLRTADAVVAYRPRPAVGVGTPTPTVEYPTPRGGRISGTADTLSTGSDAAIGRPTPTGTYRWFLPDGARVVMTAERADMVRVKLDSSTDGWFPRANIAEDIIGPVPAVVVSRPTVTEGDGWTDVRVAVGYAPFLVEAADSVLRVRLHGVLPETYRVEPAGGGVAVVDLFPAALDAATMRIHPRGRLWGFKAFYDVDGSLVLRVRNAPPIDPVQPLRGLRITVDPGHPPSGAVGPTGLIEADANLAIGQRLAAQLRIRGADVTMTRVDGGDVSLTDRVDMAVAYDSHILVSVHNNAFPEGVNPFTRNGTSSYYFHAASADLAKAMNDAIVETTLIRDLGAIQGNLALVRPTWMPSVLTEALFMPIPEQESALRDPEFLDRLAAAHVRGLERFLRNVSNGEDR